MTNDEITEAVREGVLMAFEELREESDGQGVEATESGQTDLEELSEQVEELQEEIEAIQELSTTKTDHIRGYQ